LYYKGFGSVIPRVRHFEGPTFQKKGVLSKAILSKWQAFGNRNGRQVPLKLSWRDTPAKITIAVITTKNLRFYQPIYLLFIAGKWYA